MEYGIGDFTLCTRRLQLLQKGDPLALEPQVFALLRLLVENAERVVTKDEIFEVIWKNRIVSDAALSSRIKVARAALGDDGSRQAMIRTVHGQGFHFVGPVNIRAEPDATGPIAPPIPSADTARPSLAMLPIEMLNPTETQRAFGVGIADDVATALGRIRSLYLANNPNGRDPRRVAADLGVRYLLSIRMRFAENAFRLNASLLNAARMEEVWANQFSGDMNDPFLAQDNLTTEILGALIPNILVVEVQRAAKDEFSSETAYHQMLRALPLCWSNSKGDNQSALQYLYEAADRDPDYGLAHALISWCLGQQIVYQWSGDAAKSRQTAMDHARKALRLSPKDSIVLTFVANAETSAGELAAAEHHITTSLEIDPNSAWAWSRLGYVRLFQARFDEAIEAFHRAQALSPHDPMRHSVYFGLGACHFGRQDHEAALRWLDQAMIENPEMTWAHRLIAACSAELGDLDRAAESVAILRNQSPDATAESLVTAVPIADTDFRTRLLNSYKKAGL